MKSVILSRASRDFRKERGTLPGSCNDGVTRLFLFGHRDDIDFIHGVQIYSLRKGKELVDFSTPKMRKCEGLHT